MSGLAARAERVERDAWEDLYRAAEPLGVSVGRARGASVLRAPGHDHLLLNRTIGLSSPEGVDEVIASYAAAGVSRYFVHCAPDARSIRSTLVARGLTRYPRSWVKLARGRGALPGARTELEVREARPDEAGEVGRILAAAFDMPAGTQAMWASVVGRTGWLSFVACDAGRVVAASLAFVSGRTGYLAAGATRPEHRRRGAQGALVHRRVASLLDLGCDLIVSETGESVPGDPQHSQRNLERFGLTPVYLRDNYAPSGAAWRAEAPVAWHHPGSDDAEAASLRRPGARAGGAAGGGAIRARGTGTGLPGHG